MSGRLTFCLGAGFFLVAMSVGAVDAHRVTPVRPIPKQPPVIHPRTATVTPAQTLEEQLDFSGREEAEQRLEMRHQLDEARRELMNQRREQRQEADAWRAADRNPLQRNNRALGGVYGDGVIDHRDMVGRQSLYDYDQFQREAKYLEDQREREYRYYADHRQRERSYRSQRRELEERLNRERRDTDSYRQLRREMNDLDRNHRSRYSSIEDRIRNTMGLAD